MYIIVFQERRVRKDVGDSGKEGWVTNFRMRAGHIED
jgi:hypothetical protein